MANCRVPVVLSVAVWLMAAAGVARAACDASGVDAAAIAAGRAAIDTDCPCAAAVSRAIYRRCARTVVRDLVTAAELPSGCRRETLRHATKSICGQPGAVVCCRVRSDGRTRHRVLRTAAACATTPAFTACVSGFQSVASGCDQNGCIPVPSTTTSTSTTVTTTTLPPVCGNSVLEEGEQCDPPTPGSCGATCEFDCTPAPSACGNGTIDAGEACEPPGVGGCFGDCQIAPCAAAGPAEIDVACVSGVTSVGAGAIASTHLLGWSGPQRRDAFDVLVRRFDADGVPLDAAADAVSQEACFASHGGPAIASDGVGFYALWSAFGGEPEFNAPFEAMYGRRVDAAGVTSSLDTLAMHFPFGSCRFDIFGPTMAAGISPARFALGWNGGLGCYPGGVIFQDPIGTIRDFNPSPPPAPGVPIGYGASGPPPGIYSGSAANAATLGPDTLWVWLAAMVQSLSGPFDFFVASSWTDATSGVGPTPLTGNNQSAGGRPGIAAGTASLLVAWSQRVIDTATIDTEIRAVRATRASGSLDPDGGVLLATAADRVTGSPAVAFDGTRWLVVWAERAGTTNDLRAVAVEEDGTIVDASPRLVATNVLAQQPAVSSTGDGRVLVVYGRPNGANSAVRATFVTP